METPEDPFLTFLQKIKELQDDRIKTHKRLEELESELGELRTTDRYRALITLAMWGKEKIAPLIHPDKGEPI